MSLLAKSAMSESFAIGEAGVSVMPMTVAPVSRA
jgi:hypothetical protein